MDRATLLAEYRNLLIAECALQRSTLVAQSYSFRPIVGWINKANDIVDRIYHLPSWAIGLLAGVMVFMPRHPIALIKKGHNLWQAWRAVYSKVAGK